MKNRLIAGNNIPCLMAIAALAALTACQSHDGEQAGQMTSFSAKASKSATPQLFTIPQDQMSHIQVVTVEPATLRRTLRLTGTVAYNAFKTTPVISQVGGPVEQDSCGSRRARERRAGHARREQSRLFAAP